MKSSILITKKSEGYELIDSGEGEKLERFGHTILSRPDPQAIWRKSLGENEWQNANAIFKREGKEGDWNIKEGIPEKWNIDFGGLKFVIKPTAFKHTGLFPEQLPNWDWMRETISKHKKTSGSSLKILNLFGYTGGATLACAQAGADVVHVDSSKSAINWAKENAVLSGLDEKPIRWILEDARIFVEREIKRENKYDAIIMDPPAFGHGTKNELWKIEDHLLPLTENCLKLLSDNPLFFLINGYSAGYSAIAYENLLLKMKEKYKGEIEIGELGIEESKLERLLPAGIFARWRIVRE